MNKGVRKLSCVLLSQSIIGAYIDDLSKGREQRGSAFDKIEQEVMEKLLVLDYPQKLSLNIEGDLNVRIGMQT